MTTMIATGFLCSAGHEAKAGDVQFAGVVLENPADMYEKAVSFTDQVAVLFDAVPKSESRVSVYDETSGHVFRTHRSASGMLLVPLKGHDGARMLRVCLKRSISCRRIQVTQIDG